MRDQRSDFIVSNGLEEAERYLAGKRIPDGYFFVSWSSKDQPMPRDVSAYLKRFFGSAAVYMSDDDHRTGEWEEQLAGAMARCVYFVFLTSNDSWSTAKKGDVYLWELEHFQGLVEEGNGRIIIASADTRRDMDKALDRPLGKYISAQNWATESGGVRDAETIAAGVLKSWLHTERESPTLEAVADDSATTGAGPGAATDDRQRVLHFQMRPPVDSLQVQAWLYRKWEDSESPSGAAGPWSFGLDDHSGQRVLLDSSLRVLSPILGPGTLQAEEKDEPLFLDPGLDPAKSDDFGTILGEERCLGQSVLGTAEQCKAFTKSLIKGRLNGRSAKYQESGTPKSVTSLRVALLQLAMVADQAFVTAMARLGRTGGKPLDDEVNEHARALDLGEYRDEVGQAIETAREAVRDARKELDGAWATLLGAQAIDASLESLSTQVDTEGNLDRHQVGWCSDLFWHAMTYHTSRYPQPEEVFTQLVLIHDSEKADGASLSGTRRRDAARAASAVRDMAVANRAVRLAMGRGHDHERECRRNRFFSALASSLWTDWAHRLRGRKPDDPHGRSKLALAFATTFDFEMEAALAREAVRAWESTGKRAETCPDRFHVIVPAIELIEPANREGPWLWALATFGAYDYVQWLDAAPWLGRDSQATPAEWHKMGDLSQFPERVVQGPVVVRLNGSPFIDLRAEQLADSNAQQNEFIDPSESQQHYGLPLAISDYDRVQFLMMDAQSGLVAPTNQRGASAPPNAGWPAWFFTELNKLDRMWLAMGVGMHNWNSRLFLFLHTVRVLSIEGPSRPIRALEKSLEDDRVAFLCMCQVQPVVGKDTPRSEYLQRYVEAVAQESASRQPGPIGGSRG